MITSILRGRGVCRVQTDPPRLTLAGARRFKTLLTVFNIVVRWTPSVFLMNERLMNPDAQAQAAISQIFGRLN